MIMEEHKHYWWGENKQHHPDYEVIIRMIDPRVFIKYSVRLALLADFDEFYNSIADVPVDRRQARQGNTK